MDLAILEHKCRHGVFLGTRGNCSICTSQPTQVDTAPPSKKVSAVLAKDDAEIGFTTTAVNPESAEEEEDLEEDDDGSETD